MNQWLATLKEIDDISNHQQNLEIVLEAFLTSDYANSKNKRVKVITLFNHLRKLE